MVQNSGFAIAIVIAHLQRDVSVGNQSFKGCCFIA